MCAAVRVLPYLDFRNMISYQDLSLLSRCTILQVHIEIAKYIRWTFYHAKRSDGADLSCALQTCSNISIISPYPMLRAQCQGLSPALLLALICAPKLSRSSAPCTHPSYAAWWRGVLPAASTSLTLSPASTALTIAAQRLYSELKTCATLRFDHKHDRALKSVVCMPGCAVSSANITHFRHSFLHAIVPSRSLLQHAL